MKTICGEFTEDGICTLPAGYTHRKHHHEPLFAPPEDRAQAARIEKACEVFHNAYQKEVLGSLWDTPENRTDWSALPIGDQMPIRSGVAALLDWTEHAGKRRA